MDIFFGYNPFIMITVYMLLIDGIAHVVRVKTPNAKPLAITMHPRKERCYVAMTDHMNHTLGPKW
jgi:hypothetical protein